MPRFSQNHVIRTLLGLARQYRRQFLVVVMFSFLYTGFDLAQPLIYKRAINDVAGLFVAPSEPAPAVAQPHGPGYIAARTPRQTLRTLIESVALLFLVSIISYVCSLRATWYGVHVASSMEARLISDTFGHVLRLPLSFFSGQASAGLARRIDQSDQVAPVVHAFSQEIAPEIIRLVGICVIMLTQNWEMALVSVCLLPPYMWIARRSAIRMRSNLDPWYEMWENISGRIAGAIGSVKTVKLSGAEHREEDLLRAEAGKAYGVYLDRVRVSQRYYTSQSVLSNLSKSLVLGYGGWLVLKHSLTPGDVVMFAAYLDRIYSPIDALNALAVTLQQNLAHLGRAMQLLEAGPIEPVGAALKNGPGRVEFRNVRFAYSAEREVLRGLNLILRAGEITALVGPSGAGKTTTADLLLKLFEPTSGEIFLDRQLLREIDPAAVRAAIGVVSADGSVFRGTLASNIRYKRPAASDAQVLAAAHEAGLSRLLDRLPNGIHTPVGETGVGLSLGERQRLQIARILVDRPRILVLDEATANLDYATETELRAALAQLSPPATILIVAHRYTMTRDASYIYVLRDGVVAEQGHPDDLIAAGGWFAEMAHQSGEEPEPA